VESRRRRRPWDHWRSPCDRAVRGKATERDLLRAWRAKLRLALRLRGIAAPCCTSRQQVWD
jgi:hypothetical protein